MIRLEIDTAESMEALGEKIAEQLRPGDLVGLDGELGAGKTTLVRGIGRALGVRGTVTSPTFVLARTHPSPKGPLVHVDAYRLSSAAELDDLDLDLERSIVIVEWAEGMIEELADSRLEIRIDRSSSASDEPDEVRTVTMIGHGPRFEDFRIES